MRFQVGHVATFDNLISAVQQMKQLEMIDINQCHTKKSDHAKFNDLKFLRRQLLDAMAQRVQGTSLTVILPELCTAKNKSAPVS